MHLTRYCNRSLSIVHANFLGIWVNTHITDGRLNLWHTQQIKAKVLRSTVPTVSKKPAVRNIALTLVSMFCKTGELSSYRSLKQVQYPYNL